MIHDFEEWTASLAESGPLSQLSGSIVGIDAAYFLDQIPRLRVTGIDRKIKEELTVALGGYPLGYRAVIQQIISIWRKYDITPYFVFSGLEAGPKDITFAKNELGERIHSEAWAFYDNANVTECLQKFGTSVSYTAEDMFPYLQQVLKQENVSYLVAPYGAWAQMAYLQAAGALDAIAGSSEILLFDVPDLITNWDFADDQFTWVRRRTCIDDLRAPSPDAFVDACLLAGSSFLPTIPQLNTARHLPRIRGAMDMINSTGKSGYAVCLRHQDDPQFRALNYLDRYMKAKLTVKHHVVLTTEGKVEPFKIEEAPIDVHDCVGQRLPEELYFYFSKGLIGPRILNWRTTGEHLETPPLDNGESKEYRDLVKDKLTDVRSTTIALLSYSLHRFYQHNDVKLRCWFDKENTKAISLKDSEDPRTIVNNWNVPATTFNPVRQELPHASFLGFAVLSLRDTAFAAKTIRSKDVNQPLASHEEVLLNSIWRLLQLRSYVDVDHKLTPWGEVLAAVVAASSAGVKEGQDRAEYEEAAFVAVELLRLDLLTDTKMFEYSGLSFAKTEPDRRKVLLVSRVASIAKLRHKQIGFTGALSRHLLGYHSIISAVRRSLRDLAEVCLVTMFLNGDAVREREDWIELGLDLPFLLDHGVAMGLAMNIYLNKVLEMDDPKSEQAHKEAKEHGQNTVFSHCADFAGDIDRALGLWDAVYKGVQVAGGKTKHRQLFDDADRWLSDLR